MKLWLDKNLQLDLSRDAIVEVEAAIRQHCRLDGTCGAELFTAANLIRAHLQHVLTEPPPTDEELLS